MYDLHALQLANYHYVVEKLEALEPSEEFPAYTVGLLKEEMKQHIDRLESRWSRSGTTLAGARNSEKSALIAVEARALDLERQAIIAAHEEGLISDKTAKILRDNVALMELDIEEQLE